MTFARRRALLHNEPIVVAQQGRSRGRKHRHGGTKQRLFLQKQDHFSAARLTGKIRRHFILELWAFNTAPAIATCRRLGFARNVMVTTRRAAGDFARRTLLIKDAEALQNPAVLITPFELQCQGLPFGHLRYSVRQLPKTGTLAIFEGGGARWTKAALCS